LLVGLAGITVVAVCERLIGRPFERLLTLFRDEPTWMLGEPRLSTVFYHANTLAAYLELVLPLMVITVARKQGRAVLRWAGWLVIAGYMLSLTYSRAGLGAGVFGALVLAAASGQTRRKQRLWALVFALLLCVAYFGNPDMRARLGGAKRTYKVGYEFLGICAGQPGQRVDLTVRVTNLGQWPISDRHAPGELGWVIWPTQGRPPASNFSYRPLRALSTGQHQDVPIEIQLPKQLGPHPLVVDIRRKEVVWLSAAGADLDGILCQVSSGEQIIEAKYRPMDEIQMQSRPLELSRLHYWRAALELFVNKPWLGHGADQFRWRYRDHVPDKAWDLRARAHSVVMENAADLGALGLFFIGLLATLIGLRMLANLRAVEKIAPEQLAATVGLCSFAAHSMVDYFVAYTQILLIMWPVMGLALSTELVHRTQHAPTTEPELPKQPEDGSVSL